MNWLVPVTLFGWIPMVLGIFAFTTRRRAILVSYIGAWLFLPNAEYEFGGIPEYNRVMAANASVLLAVLIFDAGRIGTFRLRPVDVPALVWCVCPFFSSISNGLGAYDGVSSAVNMSAQWGIPYFVGRLYFNDRAAIRELAVAIFIGGLVYMPLCLWEIKMSPQLHKMVYGFSTQRFLYNVRMGGYRPTVFMVTGLMVGMWMTTSALVGTWLWRTGALRRLWCVPVGPLVLCLLVTTVLCKSLYAIVLLLMGVVLIMAVKWTRSSLPVVCVVLLIPTYITARASGLIAREEISQVLLQWLPEDRVRSLEARLIQEDLFSAKAMQRPILGWAGYRRSWPKNAATGEHATRGVDGFWTIHFGNLGVTGLASITVALLMPSLMLLTRVRARHWHDPDVAPLAVVSVVLVLYMLDNLLNAMYNPIYMVIAGGLNGWFVGRREGAAVAAVAAPSVRPTVNDAVGRRGVVGGRAAVHWRVLNR